MSLEISGWTRVQFIYADLSTRCSYEKYQYHSFVLDLFTKNSLNSRPSPIEEYVSGVADANEGVLVSYMSSKCAVVSAVGGFKNIFAQ